MYKVTVTYLDGIEESFWSKGLVSFFASDHVAQWDVGDEEQDSIRISVHAIKKIEEKYYEQ